MLTHIKRLITVAHVQLSSLAVCAIHGTLFYSIKPEIYTNYSQEERYDGS